jgi:isoleucyl-tRNA synthetase
MDNSIGIGIKIEDTIIDNPDEIRQQFSDLYLYHSNTHTHTNKDAAIHILAWTTTPWTLPSNMFLAV